MLAVTYTGLAASFGPTRCAETGVVILPDHEVVHMCLRTEIYTTLVAVDTLKLTFPAATLDVAASVSSSIPPAKVGYLSNGQVTASPLVWDAGNDGLPGPLH
jgi:hypothetical protein